MFSVYAMPLSLLWWAFLQRSKMPLVNCFEKRRIPLELMRLDVFLGNVTRLSLECFVVGSRACDTKHCIQENSFLKLRGFVGRRHLSLPCLPHGE